MPSPIVRPLRALGALALVVALAASAGLAVAATTADAKAPARHIIVPGLGMRAVQRALGVSADGEWGPQTARALRRFQRRHRLEVDGVVGPATARALGVLRTASAVRVSVSLRARLARIAACESGNDPRAVSPSGLYRGKYQFSRATWQAVGGTGDPARASVREQDRRAAILWTRTRGAAWPNCG